MIKAQNISKWYDDLQVLKNVSISINEREIISIVGASGAGKSTLLQILGTLDVPTDVVKNQSTVEIVTSVRGFKILIIVSNSLHGKILMAVINSRRNYVGVSGSCFSPTLKCLKTPSSI